MNRREALAALTALPAVQRIATLTLKPSDTLVVESDGYLSDEERANILSALKQVWPEHERIIVLEAGLKLKVVEAERKAGR